MPPTEKQKAEENAKNRNAFKRFLSFLSQLSQIIAMCNHFSLPGISCIAYLAANSLPSHLTMQSMAGLQIFVVSDLTNVPFNGEPTCECTQSNAQGSPSQSVEFSFRATMQLPDEFHLAFLVIDANGEYYLIGTKEEHPLVERVQSFGSPDADPNSFTYNVSLTSPRSLIPCRVS